jgi:hypothetical protein
MPNDALSDICCAFQAASNSGAALAVNAPKASNINLPQAMFIVAPAEELEALRMAHLATLMTCQVVTTGAFATRHKIASRKPCLQLKDHQYSS